MSIVHNSFDHHKAPGRMRHLIKHIGKVLRRPGKSLYKPREAGRSPYELKHARGRADLIPTLKELQTAGFESLRAIAATSAVSLPLGAVSGRRCRLLAY